jgi:hypothetical protein
MASFETRLGMHTQTLDEGHGLEARHGRKLMLVLGVLAAISLSLLFRPRAPSPFTAPGAYGAGHGSMGIMFGASPRAGAPRLNTH